ncbi:unnamed protein product [Moneuplotes crassus]|uniref:Uncharacterized protein n=1 Tax=Euplotes crassus TaxID=5936 RepID=A0AAD1U8M1_EUPCR|nr:unnamed protein product [Moneuplotes crassus]
MENPTKNLALNEKDTLNREKDIYQNIRDHLTIDPTFWCKGRNKNRLLHKVQRDLGNLYTSLKLCSHKFSKKETMYILGKMKGITLQNLLVLNHRFLEDKYLCSVTPLLPNVTVEMQFDSVKISPKALQLIFTNSVNSKYLNFITCALSPITKNPSFMHKTSISTLRFTLCEGDTSRNNFESKVLPSIMKLISCSCIQESLEKIEMRQDIKEWDLRDMKERYSLEHVEFINFNDYYAQAYYA